MTDLIFDEVVAWLNAREGVTVLVELGAFEPDLALQRAVSDDATR